MNPLMIRQWPALDGMPSGAAGKTGRGKAKQAQARHLNSGPGGQAGKARGFSPAKGAEIHEVGGRLREDGPKAIAATAISSAARGAAMYLSMIRQWPALDAHAKREGRQSRTGQSKSPPAPVQARQAGKARCISLAKPPKSMKPRADFVKPGRKPLPRQPAPPP